MDKKYSRREPNMDKFTENWESVQQMLTHPWLYAEVG